MLKTTYVALATVLAIHSAMADPVEWTLDQGHAHVGWEIDHMNMANTVGRFDAFDGTFLIDEEEPSNSAITFTIDATSINSNHVGRDTHLRNADYLNASEYPTIDFVSTDVQMLTPTSGNLVGDLTILGNSAPIELEFEMVNRRFYPDFIPNYDEVEVVGFHVAGEIARLDHGLDFIAFIGSPTGFVIDLDARFDLVQCDGAPDTNIPCNWGRVEGFTGPNEN